MPVTTEESKGLNASDEETPLRIDVNNRLLVSTQDELHPGFLAVKTTAAALPACITSTGTAPFAIGGETLNIKVNGVAQSVTFSTTPATAGTSTSDYDPATSNASKNKFKISIDGGASTEIEISKSLTSGVAIAADIEDEIQSEVPNGGSATCDYDSSAPGKYRVTSGTTGSSSSVVIVDSGKSNMAAILKMGVVNGGLEIVGTDANSYSVYDVVEELNSQLSDISAYVIDGDVAIKTLDIGASTTLEVTGGAANTDLGFTTDEVTGSAPSGATDLAVDGSSVPVVFRVPLHSQYKYVVTRIVYAIRDASASNNTFGGLAELTNGVKVEVENYSEPLHEWFIVKTNSELLSRAGRGQLIISAYATDDLVYADFVLSPGIVLRPGSSDTVQFTVQDDLSGLTAFDILAEGYLYT